MIWSMSPANVVSSMWKSSMTISADRQAGRWRAPDSTAWLHGYARAKSAPFYASMRRGSREMAAIGTTCSNYAGLSKRASSMPTASIIRVGQMIDCSWE
jgi:hypothetical protein